MSTSFPQIRVTSSTASHTETMQARPPTTTAEPSPHHSPLSPLAPSSLPPPSYTDRFVTLSEIGDLLRPLLQRLDEQALHIQRLEQRLEQGEQTWTHWLTESFGQLRLRLGTWKQWFNRLLLSLQERILLINLRGELSFYQDLLEDHPDALARGLAAEESLVQ